MIKHFLRKRFYRNNLSLLRGAKILREQNKPFYVVNIFSSLTDISLDLDQKKFPKILVGNHALKIEILLRQILLKKRSKYASTIMQSIGENKSLVIGMPQAWVVHLTSSGVTCSPYLCKIQLFISSIIQLIYGIYKLLYLAIRISNTNYVRQPYVVFVGLNKQNLPNHDVRESFDITSWYKKSIIIKNHIKEVWLEVRGDKNRNISSNIFINNNIFPRLSNWSDYFLYLFKILLAFMVSIFGILRGRWWYGFLFAESINLHYVKLLKRELLAEEYFFSNSEWLYKPLWSEEAESKGSDISLYYYSTNIETIQFNDHIKHEMYGITIMSWNRFIVWDEAQRDYLKQYMPDANYIIVATIDFSDSGEIVKLDNAKFNIAVFDVYAVRPICYVGLGFACEPYYSTKVLSDFLTDIGSISEYGNIELLYKQKRVAKKVMVSPAAMKQKNTIIKKYYKNIDPDISAKYLINNSDAVISMPFTSTAIIGKELGIPSIYYDASGVLEQTIHHGIPILKNKDELNRWYVSLDIEKKAKIY